MNLKRDGIIAGMAALMLWGGLATAEDAKSSGESGGSDLYQRARALLGEEARQAEPKPQETAAASEATNAEQESPAPKPVADNADSQLPGFSEVAPRPTLPPPPDAPRPRELPRPEPRVIRLPAPAPEGGTPPPPAQAPGQPSTAPAAGPPSAPAAPRTPPQTSYTIEPGDTFSSIALKLYGDEKRWTAIARANPLVDPVRLKVGQVIRMPDLQAQEQQRRQQLEVIQRQVAAPDAAAQEITVEPGDTLSGIAHRVYGRAALWKAIFEANRDQLNSPDELKVGMKLKVPPRPSD